LKAYKSLNHSIGFTGRLRRSRHSLYFLFIAISLNSFSALAESLSWQQCLSETAEHNPDLRAARENLRSAEQQLKGSYSGFYPQINATFGSTWTQPNFPDANGSMAIVTGSPAALNLTHNLFSGFQDSALVSQAKANRDVALANLNSQLASLSYDLKAAYLQLLYTQNAVGLAKVIQERRALNERLVRSLYESGHENEGSYLVSQSALDEAGLDVMSNENDQTLAREKLATLLGRDPFSPIEISGSLAPHDVPSVKDFSALVEDVPGHLLAAAKKLLAAASVRTARSGFFPSLDLTASLTNPSDYAFRSGNGATVGLLLTIPLFNGFKTSTGLESALALERSADQTLFSTDRLIIDQLRASYLGLRQAILREKLEQRFVNSLRVREKISRKKYNMSLMSFDDWDRAENELIGREKSALQSQRDRMLAEANWQKSQGKGELP
jgi:outer membrane protein